MSSVRDHLPAGSVVSIIGKVSAEPVVNLIQSKLVFPRLLYGLENKSKKERGGGEGNINNTQQRNLAFPSSKLRLF
jgi:hypothetical protein